MRNFARVSLVMAGSAALVGSMALPASAAQTNTTVTINGGGVAITAPEASAAGNVDPGASATISLLGMQVIDTRAGVLDWNATASLGAFNGEDPANIMLPDTATYTAGQATPGGTVTVTEQAPVDLAALTAAAPVQAATAVSGNNTAAWAATLEIVTPADALADNYTAVLVHSVS